MIGSRPGRPRRSSRVRSGAATENREDSRVWDQVVEDWHASPRYSLWRRHSDALWRSLLGRWAPQDKVERALKTDLFDEAVGEGVATALLDRARTVVGMDVSAGVVSRARSRTRSLRGFHVARMDARALPLAPESFDLVASFSSLDHFPRSEDLERALVNLAGVLRPGGVLIMVLDNPRHPLVDLRSHLPGGLLLRLGLVPYPIGRTLGVASLCRILRGAGLDIEEATAVEHCPRMLAVHLGTLLWRLTGARTHVRYLRGMEAFEALGRWPTRWLTGHYVAVRAVRPCEGGPDLGQPAELP